MVYGSGSSSSKTRMTKSGRARMKMLTREDITKYQGKKSPSDACKLLGVSRKSLNVQAHYLGQHVWKYPNGTLKRIAFKRVQLTLSFKIVGADVEETDTRKIEVPDSEIFSEVKTKIDALYGLDPDAYHLSYKYREEMWANLCNDSHWESCLKSNNWKDLIELRGVMKQSYNQ